MRLAVWELKIVALRERENQVRGSRMQSANNSVAKSIAPQ